MPKAGATGASSRRPTRKAKSVGGVIDMSKLAKAMNQCQRLPREIEAAKRRGDEAKARQTAEHLARARALVNQRGRGG